jgi:hypothetical protein
MGLAIKTENRKYINIYIFFMYLYIKIITKSLF